MNRISKMMMVGLSLLLMQFAYAQSSGSTNQSCGPKECAKPCPTPKPCPPKPCKPCPPVCLERGHPDTNCCLASAYNEPADFELSPCPWDVWVDASFTYWIAYQAGLDLAISQSTLGVNDFNSWDSTSIVFQDTKWKPGFKVGMGVDFGHDHWSGFAEYTWFRSRTTTSASTPTAPTGTTSPTWFINNWDLGQSSTYNIESSSFSSTFRLRMDLLDLALTRPYYQGTHLIVAPFGGFRVAWIRESLRMASTPFDTQGNNRVLNPNTVFHNRSQSWAVGPRAGCQAKWHLGWGFRFEGDMAGSITYTRYTKVKAIADSVQNQSVPHRLVASYTDLNAVRFNNDMNVGLGWGDYFDCRNYHLDILLTYDFQIFWNQNMMRALADDATYSIGASPNNLYLHGLTVRAQFDF